MTNPDGAIEREWVNIGPDTQDTVAAEFVSHLKGLGHTDLTLTGYRDGARHFCEWLRRSGVAIDAVDDDVFERFARHRCKWSRGRWHNRPSFKYVVSGAAPFQLPTISSFAEQRRLIKS